MMRTTGRRPLALVAALAMSTASGLVALVPHAALAAPSAAARVDGAAPDVRWSIMPADASGPDGRRSVDVILDPGRRVEDHIAVRNGGDAETTFRLTAADGFTTASGRFDVLVDAAASVDAGTWISLPDSVTVPAGRTVVVPFTIAAPATAAPGDHSAGITASVRSGARADGGTGVGIESRVGLRVLARVTGDIAPAASVHAAAGSYDISWNPLRAGSAVVTFDVVNDGDIRLQAAGTVSAGGRTVAFPAEGESSADLLPGDRRTLRVVVDGVWPSLHVPATITLTPRALAIAGDAPAVPPASVDTALWALPAAQAVVLVGAALIILAVSWGRVRSRRRTDRLVADAGEPRGPFTDTEPRPQTQESTHG